MLSRAASESLAALDSISVGVLRRELKFQTCTNTLNKFFVTIPGIFVSPHIYIYIYIVLIFLQL